MKENYPGQRQDNVDDKKCEPLSTRGKVIEFPN